MDENKNIETGNNRVNEEEMEYYQPIGSVVLLKNTDKPLMITGYAQINEKNELYDYSSCLFPEGILSSQETYVFNNDQIDKLIFRGYVNQDQLEFMDKAKEIIRKEKEKRSNIQQKENNKENIKLD